MGASDMLEIQFIKNVLECGWIFHRKKTLNKVLVDIILTTRRMQKKF